MRELEDAVQRPQPIQNQDHVDDGPAQQAPVSFPEAGQFLRKGSTQRPQLQNHLQQQNRYRHGGDGNGKDQ